MEQIKHYNSVKLIEWSPNMYITNMIFKFYVMLNTKTCLIKNVSKLLRTWSRTVKISIIMRTYSALITKHYVRTTAQCSAKNSVKTLVKTRSITTG